MGGYCIHYRRFGGTTAFVDIAFVAAHLLVAARTKGFVAGTGQNNCTYRIVVMCAVEGVNQLLDRFRAEGVAPLGAVDGDPRDAFGSIVEDVGVGGLGLPGGGFAGHGDTLEDGQAASIAFPAACGFGEKRSVAKTLLFC